MLDFFPRILWHYFKSLFRPRPSILDSFSTRLRVWPMLDTDGFRYFAVPSFLSAAAFVIWSHTLRSGFFRHCLRNKWVFVTKRQYSRYYKPIPIFATYTATTRVASWTKYSFIRQVEYHRGDILCARVYFELFTLAPGRGKLTVDEVWEKGGIGGAVPGPWPQEIAEWKASN